MDSTPPALLEVHVLGGVFVGNRSAGVAALAGVSITSAVSHLADIDHVPASETHLLRSTQEQQGLAADPSRMRLPV